MQYSPIFTIFYNCYDHFLEYIEVETNSQNYVV